MNDATPCFTDPSARLEDAFRRAAERMRGLPFVNPAVEVEAVGFAPWGAHWLGVMVTPWFMNLVLAPRDPGAWHALAPGAKRSYVFPAGTFEFIGASDESIGDYLACSLYSPLLEFSDHASARLVATLARAALLDPANSEVPAMPSAELAPAAARTAVGPIARLEEQLSAPLSKREFLRGRCRGGERADRR
jgi:[NiFe] hydrogenase assembly HybE family chaperone